MGWCALPSSPAGLSSGEQRAATPHLSGDRLHRSDHSTCAAFRGRGSSPALPPIHCGILLSSPASLLLSVTWTLSSRCPLHSRDRPRLKSEGTYSNSLEENVNNVSSMNKMTQGCRPRENSDLKELSCLPNPRKRKSIRNQNLALPRSNQDRVPKSQQMLTRYPLFKWNTI